MLLAASVAVEVVAWDAVGCPGDTDGCARITTTVTNTGEAPTPEVVSVDADAARTRDGSPGTVLLAGDCGTEPLLGGASCTFVRHVGGDAGTDVEVDVGATSGPLGPVAASGSATFPPALQVTLEHESLCNEVDCGSRFSGVVRNNTTETIPGVLVNYGAGFRLEGTVGFDVFRQPCSTEDLAPHGECTFTFTADGRYAPGITGSGHAEAFNDDGVRSSRATVGFVLTR